MKMNIVISINRRYLRIAYVMLKSLFLNNKSGKITVYLLHSELLDEDISVLKELAEEYGHDVSPLFVDRSLLPKELPTTAAWSIETYYRLMLLDLLPNEIHRVLYLDVDIIVLKDLKELYESDFSGFNFIACDDADPQGKNFPDRAEKFSEAYKNGHRYFNAGVMLWNIEALREKYSLDMYIRLAKKYDFKLSCLDQDMLNLMHWGEILYADQKYNYYARVRSLAGDTVDDARKASIIHFVSEKPWEANNYHFPIEGIWWEYAKKTPFYRELLEEFLDKILNDNTTFLYASSLYQNNIEIKKALDESMELNKKLISKLTKG